MTNVCDARPALAHQTHADVWKHIETLRFQSQAELVYL